MKIVLLNGIKNNEKTAYEILHNITLNVNHQQPPQHGIFYTWPEWWKGKNSAPRERINLFLLIPVIYSVVTFV